MPLWRLFYHVVVATAQRRPVLTPLARQAACRLTQHKAEELGCLVHAINAQPDHVHIVLSIPPGRSVASVVGQVKGSSSHGIAVNLPPWSMFAWQPGYGVFSIGEKDGSEVVRYVHDQDRHHAAKDLWFDFETSLDAPPEGPTADV